MKTASKPAVPSPTRSKGAPPALVAPAPAEKAVPKLTPEEHEKFKRLSEDIAKSRSKKKSAEDEEKKKRKEFEVKFPPGTPTPDDFAVEWGERSELQCADPSKVDKNLTDVALNTKKVRAYQELHDGKLPEGVTEETGHVLKTR